MTLITLEPVAATYNVAYPTRDMNEFELHAWLYGKLKNIGLDVRGEVRWFDPVERIQCRFDLVIFENKRPHQIIEVKPPAAKRGKSVEDTRQGRRYRLFGVPVTFVYGAEDAKALLGSFAGA